ncbi:FAD/NAD(P)-binding oxidoreductase [Halorhabdus salina]|uniref:FAD/NAD(P)-binding oxidoreductase n=1 Tax=Halorhabdus salina TaxID=2750670 RepID=UPI0015EF378F|nr:FAD/NAD(P)-binding oxidoreductase [Halorhabdus salina]
MSPLRSLWSPDYVSDGIDRLEELVAIPTNWFPKERDIDLRTGPKATAIDPDRQELTETSEDGETYQRSYGDLLVSTGAMSTDEYRQTNVENAHPAGDCAEMTHAVTSQPTSRWHRQQTGPAAPSGRRGIPTSRWRMFSEET